MVVSNFLPHSGGGMLLKQGIGDRMAPYYLQRLYYFVKMLEASLWFECVIQ